MGARPTRWSLLYLVFLLYTIACRRPEPPQTITISNVSAFKPSSPGDLNTVRDELAAIITVCRDDLKLPVVDPLYLYLYKTTTSFKFYTGRGVYADIEAFTEGNKIHVDLEKVGNGPWVSTLAHEYAHAIQDQIGRLKTIPFFLNEGFAYWVSASVLHFLKWQDLTITRHRIITELIRHRDALPNINLLYESDEPWINSQKQWIESLATHDLATITVDQLIQERGLSAFITYQQNSDFEKIYGIPFSQFAAKLGKSIRTEVPNDTETFNLLRPDWKVGYRWSYVHNEAGQITFIPREVIGEEIFRGRGVFVVRSLDREFLYDKEDFTTLAIRKSGKTMTEIDKQTGFLHWRKAGFLSWPLQPRKEWRVTLTQKDMVKHLAFNFDHFMVATGVEKIRVQGGEFESVKLESYGAITGRLHAEYWYSPQVMWFVKVRIYNDEIGVTEEELSRAELTSPGSIHYN